MFFVFLLCGSSGLSAHMSWHIGVKVSFFSGTCTLLASPSTWMFILPEWTPLLSGYNSAVAISLIINVVCLQPHGFCWLPTNGHRTFNYDICSCYKRRYWILGVFFSRTGADDLRIGRFLCLGWFIRVDSIQARFHSVNFGQTHAKVCHLLGSIILTIGSLARVAFFSGCLCGVMNVPWILGSQLGHCIHNGCRLTPSFKTISRNRSYYRTRHLSCQLRQRVSLPGSFQKVRILFAALNLFTALWMVTSRPSINIPLVRSSEKASPPRVTFVQRTSENCTDVFIGVFLKQITSDAAFAILESVT